MSPCIQNISYLWHLFFHLFNKVFFLMIIWKNVKFMLHFCIFTVNWIFSDTLFISTDYLYAYNHVLLWVPRIHLGIKVKAKRKIVSGKRKVILHYINVTTKKQHWIKDIFNFRSPHYSSDRIPIILSYCWSSGVHL